MKNFGLILLIILFTNTTYSQLTNKSQINYIVLTKKKSGKELLVLKGSEVTIQPYDLSSKAVKGVVQKIDSSGLTINDQKYRLSNIYSIKAPYLPKKIFGYAVMTYGALTTISGIIYLSISTGIDIESGSSNQNAWAKLGKRALVTIGATGVAIGSGITYLGYLTSKNGRKFYSNRWSVSVEST